MLCSDCAELLKPQHTACVKHDCNLVPRIFLWEKYRTQGGVGKVSNYINMLPVRYLLKTNFANY